MPGASAGRIIFRKTQLNLLRVSILIFDSVCTETGTYDHNFVSILFFYYSKVASPTFSDNHEAMFRVYEITVSVCLMLVLLPSSRCCGGVTVWLDCTPPASRTIPASNTTREGPRPGALWALAVLTEECCEREWLQFLNLGRQSDELKPFLNIC